MRFNRLFFAIPFLAALACSPSGDELIDPDEPVGDAAYQVNFRGSTRDWNPDEVSFNINSVDYEGSGVYRWILRMQWGASPEDHPADVAFAFHSDQSIFDINQPLDITLVRSYDFFNDLNCTRNPAGCLNIGYGLISGTQPRPPESGAGLGDDLHSLAGTLTIDDIGITKRANRVVEGHVSGGFSLNGINTNASAPNPGTASGTFEFAPFQIFDFAALLAGNAESDQYYQPTIQADALFMRRLIKLTSPLGIQRRKDFNQHLQTHLPGVFSAFKGLLYEN